MNLTFWLGLYFSDSNYVSKIDSHANLTDLVKEEEAQKPAALRWESEADFLLFWNQKLIFLIILESHIQPFEFNMRV